MDVLHTGAAIPIWILGAGFLGILIEWMRSPRAREGYERLGTTRAVATPQSGAAPAATTVR